MHHALRTSRDAGVNSAHRFESGFHHLTCQHELARARALSTKTAKKKNKEVGLSHQRTLTVGRRKEPSLEEGRKCRFQPNTRTVFDLPGETSPSVYDISAPHNSFTVQRESADAFVREVRMTLSRCCSYREKRTLRMNQMHRGKAKLDVPTDGALSSSSIAECACGKRSHYFGEEFLRGAERNSDNSTEPIATCRLVYG